MYEGGERGYSITLGIKLIYKLEKNSLAAYHLTARKM
jgi:hypothetical protein